MSVSTPLWAPLSHLHPAHEPPLTSPHLHLRRHGEQPFHSPPLPSTPLLGLPPCLGYNHHQTRSQSQWQASHVPHMRPLSPTPPRDDRPYLGQAAPPPPSPDNMREVRYQSMALINYCTTGALTRPCHGWRVYTTPWPAPPLPQAMTRTLGEGHRVKGGAPQGMRGDEPPRHALLLPPPLTKAWDLFDLIHKRNIYQLLQATVVNLSTHQAHQGLAWC